jgi:hypothetical protein
LWVRPARVLKAQQQRKRTELDDLARNGRQQKPRGDGEQTQQKQSLEMKAVANLDAP